MAFGYRYWLLFLPDIQPGSFLLFVHNPAGSTKLRDYSSGREKVVGQPPVNVVFARTEIGKTRFQCDPHPTTDYGFWFHKTVELNNRYLNGSGSAAQIPLSRQMQGPPQGRPRQMMGRAIRGSQRQIQDYVNDCPEVLSQAVLDRLPARVRELGAQIRWVSPLAGEQYCEYRDADFLQRVGLGNFAKELADFWPGMGPSWDALGVISDSVGKMKPGAVLVEAKSHIPEVYGNGCQASAASRIKIEAALRAARSWCGVSTDKDWLGPLYQSANRIAHLYFLYNRLRTSVWLVNLYFTDDPIGPTGRDAWEHDIANVKAQLGLTEPVRNMIEVFLPALPVQETVAHHAEEASQALQDKLPQVSATIEGEFESWTRRWMDLANFAGPHLPEPASRIQHVLDLWDEEIPGSYVRGIDTQLLGNRYRRGDFAQPHSGEHTIEHEILCGHFTDINCLGGRLVDGINAMPLVRDEGGGRRANVEADLFLLLEKAGAYHLVLCEVKHSSNTPWYAVIENLRQLRLLQHSPAARKLFHQRNPNLTLAAELPMIGLVIAPAEYYSQPGQKSNVLPHVRTLVKMFIVKTAIDVSLAIWDANASAIGRI